MTITFLQSFIKQEIYINSYTNCDSPGCVFPLVQNQIALNLSHVTSANHFVAIFVIIKM
jgi:hypothetical protein